MTNNFHWAKFSVCNSYLLYLQKRERDYVPRVRFDDDDLPRNRGYDRGPAVRHERDDVGSFSAPTARRHERSESGPSQNSIVPTGMHGPNLSGSIF